MTTCEQHRSIAATLRSTSASVVLQFDTEMRISRMPCQVVPPIQHSPACCTASITGKVQRSQDADEVAVELIQAGTGVAVWEKHYHRPGAALFLVQDDIVQHGDSVDRRQLIGEASRQPATPVDQIGNAASAQLAQRCIGGETSGPA